MHRSTDLTHTCSAVYLCHMGQLHSFCDLYRMAGAARCSHTTSSLLWSCCIYPDTGLSMGTLGLGYIA